MAHSFMQIPALRDPKAEDPFEGWTNIKSCSHGLTLEVTDYVGSKERSASKLTFNEIEVRKPMCHFSQRIRIACCTGTLLEEVNLAFRREDQKEIYMKLELKDVFVSDVSYSIDDGEESEETLKLNCRELVWKFRPKLKDDVYGPWIVKGWDRSAQSEVVIASK